MLDYVDVEIGLYCKVADQTVSILTDINITTAVASCPCPQRFNIEDIIEKEEREESGIHQTPRANCECHQTVFISQHSFYIFKTFMVRGWVEK